ncbi:MAG: tetratricopeptide repeat protein [Thermoanaerobaculia bacterium]
MMLQRHYDDEALIAILHSGEEAVSHDTHLAGCDSCAQSLESYRVIAEILGDKVVWDLHEAHQDEAAKGAAALRSFAASMESEDERAAILVEELLSSRRQWWVATVARDERYHDAGVVRRLIAVSEAKIDSMPPDAVELAAAAGAVADALQVSEAVLQLRGSAYRQHAYSLFYIGDFTRSLEWVDRAQQVLEGCAVSEYALARLDVVRSLVHGAQERYDDALQVARRAATTFRRFGDMQRLASALMSQAYLLMNARNFRGALPLLLDLEKNFSSTVDLYTRALTHHNLGVCHQELGHVSDALDAYQVAGVLYEENSTATEAARVRHNVAILLSGQGKQAEAKKRLREVQGEFARLGMAHAAVIAGLELAEIALLENNLQEVENLCRAAMRQFEAAGVAYSSEALTALTFLREAAEQRRATQEVVWHVKTYIRRLPDEPALLFAPAPPPPA